ncbi:MAG: gliding motility protein GldN [Flavisolibacter sp.]|jgi:gliding motility associated protien GldN|nr:gliding motility protein GldN [Flavisolibacter sp.]
MKSRIIKISLFAGILSLAISEASAQRAPRRRTDGTQPAQQQPQQQNNNTTQPSGYNPYGNIPIRVDSTSEFDNSTKKSLRNDNATDKTGINDRTPLDYEHLRWDDALYAEKVWRELDLREKLNAPFRYEADDDNGSQIFINMLLQAVNSGEVTAFGDERFTTPMALTEIGQLTTGSADTVARTDIDDPSKVVEYVVTRASFDPKTVVKLRIKEEWVFDREASRMFVRILGIAPLKTLFNPNGTERGSTVMFWVYYPDLRPMLAKYEVYNPKNMGTGRMTWEELFESRMFSSYITKSTLDNAANRTVRQMMRDPILALLEGENIKEKIFNYEQDLWSY